MPALPPSTGNLPQRFKQLEPKDKPHRHSGALQKTISKITPNWEFMSHDTAGIHRWRFSDGNSTN
jgi:hypothetical protein